MRASSSSRTCSAPTTSTSARRASAPRRPGVIVSCVGVDIAVVPISRRSQPAACGGRPVRRAGSPQPAGAMSMSEGMRYSVTHDVTVSQRGDMTAPVLDPLLAAARDCVMDVGLKRTTLADVARRAGVSRMTVYRQYGDLQTIVNKLLECELLALIEQG